MHACTIALSCTDGDIKLVGGSTSNEGTLQVCANYTWGTVCDNNWSVQDATVACKQLGLSKYGIRERAPSTWVCNNEFICYLGATSYRNNPFQAAVTGGIVWKNVVCTGSETKLGDCRRTNNTSGCTHFSDVGVSCSSCKDVAHPSCMHAHDSHLGCTIASSNQTQEYLVRSTLHAS